MLAAGASLLVAAGFASAAGTHHAAPVLKKGGVFRDAEVGPGLSMDPQITYYTTTWYLEYATAAKLYNYPDKAGPAGSRLIPEVASKFTVSKSGKKYTFTIRKNFKFSNGKKVTAKNFAFAIKRTLNTKLQSPGAQFITDNSGTFIKKYRAKGSKLIITLKHPDGTFLAKITLPFFQATSTSLPLTKEVATVSHANQIPSAGPYMLTFNDPQRATTIKKNKFYKPGTPGHKRPRNLNGYTMYWNQQTQQAFLQTLKNQFDIGPVPPEDQDAMLKRFGRNKSRYFIEATVCTGYIPMNTSHGLFQGNPALRKAINLIVSRRDYAAQAGQGAAPWSNILPPGMPGWSSKQIWPHVPSIAKARRTAAGHFKNHKINVWWRSSGVVGPAQKQIINRDLQRLGYHVGDIHYTGFPGGDIYTAMGHRGANFDMGLGVGWCQDYPDPFDWFNILLYGPGITADNNVNLAYFNNPKWNKKIAAASRKTGKARIDAYAALDKQINAQSAPWAPMRTYNNISLFSNRVNKKSLIYQGVYQDWSIPALALK